MTDDIFSAEHRAEMETERYLAIAEEDKQRFINFNLVFGSREGLSVLKDIMSICHPLATSYVPSNQYETAFREGERNVFLYIMSQLSDEMKSQIIGGFGGY